MIISTMTLGSLSVQGEDSFKLIYAPETQHVLTFYIGIDLEYELDVKVKTSSRSCIFFQLITRFLNVNGKIHVQTINLT